MTAVDSPLSGSMVPQSEPPGAGTVLDAIPAAVLAVDGHDRITTMNAAAESLLGCSRRQMAQAPLAEALHVGPDLAALLARARTTGAATGELNVRVRRGAGEFLPASISAAHMFDPGTGHDPGAGPGSPLVLLIRTDPLRKLYRPGLGAQRPSGLAALIAHEARTPLAGLKGAAQFLLRDAGEGDRGLLEIIVAESDRIARLIDRLDSVSPMDPGTKSALNIHSVLRRAREIALASFASGLGIAEDFDPSLPPVVGHEDLLVQAVLNLLRNGAEAMEHAPPIVGARVKGPENRPPALSITTRARSGVTFGGTARGGRGGAEICVTDRGCGIPEDIRASLFLPFVTTKPRGTGLGLSVVAEAAAAHGGLIEYESRPGLTTFRLVLPLGPADRRPESESAAR